VQAYEYGTMFEFETWYWWYKGLHRILRDLLRSQGVGPGAWVLDAGCGTGQNLLNIAKEITPNTVGFDLSSHATAYCQQRGLERVCIASVNDVPYMDNAFDVVLCVDVLESEAVDQKQAYGELWRVAKDSGLIALVVPAYRWLLTKEHHQAVGATRRYQKREIVSLVRTRPVQIIRVTHLFALLFPAVAGYRLTRRQFESRPDEEPRSELQFLPEPLNRLLTGVMDVERRLLTRFDMPFGSSILVVARKGAP
jgi:SAM-dependent methyltransferase